MPRATSDERIEYHALGLLAESGRPVGSPALAENGFTYQPAITAYLRATDHWRPSLWGRPHLLFFTRDDVIATERSGGTHPA